MIEFTRCSSEKKLYHSSPTLFNYQPWINAVRFEVYMRFLGGIINSHLFTTIIINVE